MSVLAVNVGFGCNRIDPDIYMHFVSLCLLMGALRALMLIYQCVIFILLECVYVFPLFGLSCLGRFILYAFLVVINLLALVLSFSHLV